MAKNSAASLLTSVDSLFTTQEERDKAPLETVVHLSPSEISDFPNHPFRVRMDNAMMEIVESVKRYGVLVPGLVRPKPDGGYGRVLFLKEYASYIKDDILSELCSLERPAVLTLDIIPVPTDEAVREAESRLLGVERNIVDFLRKQQNNQNYSGNVSYELEKQRSEMKEFLDDLTSRDQRMMFANLTFVHTADTKEQLDQDTEYIQTAARQRMCQMAVMRFQQLDGLNTALPIGMRRIHALRTLTTESLAVSVLLLYITKNI